MNEAGFIGLSMLSVMVVLTGCVLPLAGVKLVTLGRVVSGTEDGPVVKVELKVVTGVPFTPRKPETWIAYTVDAVSATDGTNVRVARSEAKLTVPVTAGAA